jgi:hypothetical protein
MVKRLGHYSEFRVSVAARGRDMGNRITLDDIENRLGKHPRPEFVPDDEFEPEEPEEDSSMGVGFIASCFAVFLAVGFGTFYFSGGGGFNLPVPNLSLAWHSELKSSVDDSCNVGWESNRSNIDQMHCYFTKDIKRLCKSEERNHLVAKIKKFNEAYMIARGSEIGAVMANAGGGMANPNMVQLGVQGARATDRSLSQDEQDEAMTQAIAAADRMTAPIMEIAKRSINKNSMADLKADLVSLVKNGYFAPEDFGYFRSVWIRKATDGVAQGPSQCSNG